MENDRWIVELVRGAGAMLFLASVRLRISMAELYEGSLSRPAPTANEPHHGPDLLNSSRSSIRP